tara:strand:- start:1953 stop:2378 length:426 start_codon:yes stop_codon:yes gene_type:complete
MNVQVTYDDSDVAKALESIIENHNHKEFVRLLTPLLCQNSQATTWFFKLMLGNKLPEVIPNGTLCRVLVQDLDYNANKSALLKTHLVDNEDKVIAKVKEFRGWHEHSNYVVRYTNWHHDNDVEYEETSYVQAYQLEVIEEI